jgi:hypothetical protein
MNFLPRKNLSTRDENLRSEEMKIHGSGNKQSLMWGSFSKLTLVSK